jgi:hypothetical protein
MVDKKDGILYLVFIIAILLFCVSIVTYAIYKSSKTHDCLQKIANNYCNDNSCEVRGINQGSFVIINTNDRNIK